MQHTPPLQTAARVRWYTQLIACPALAYLVHRLDELHNANASATVTSGAPLNAGAVTGGQTGRLLLCRAEQTHDHSSTCAGIERCPVQCHQTLSLQRNMPAVPSPAGIMSLGSGLPAMAKVGGLGADNALGRHLSAASEAFLKHCSLSLHCYFMLPGRGLANPGLQQTYCTVGPEPHPPAGPQPCLPHEADGGPAGGQQAGRRCLLLPGGWLAEEQREAAATIVFVCVAQARCCHSAPCACRMPTARVGGTVRWVGGPAFLPLTHGAIRLPPAAESEGPEAAIQGVEAAVCYCLPRSGGG